MKPEPETKNPLQIKQEAGRKIDAETKKEPETTEELLVKVKSEAKTIRENLNIHKLIMKTPELRRTLFKIQLKQEEQNKQQEHEEIPFIIIHKPKFSLNLGAVFNLGLVLAFTESIGYLAYLFFMVYPISLLLTAPPLAFSAWLLYEQLSHMQKQPQTNRRISNTRSFWRDEERFWLDYDTGYFG